MNLTKKDWLNVIVIAAFSAAANYFAANSQFSEAAFFGIVIFVLVVLQLEIYRRAKKGASHDKRERENDFKQVEDLVALYILLKIEKPLPRTRGWAISPDFGLILAHKLLELRPDTVLELGSGVSTIVMAYCLKHIGKGKIISWEHDEKFAGETRKMIKAHGLEHLAQVEYRPLKNTELDGKTWMWYDTQNVNLSSINFLTVDGPSSPKASMARYPALSILKPYLAKNVVVILDDANRKDEREIVSLWLKDFPNFAKQFIDTEKGTVILSQK